MKIRSNGEKCINKEIEQQAIRRGEETTQVIKQQAGEDTVFFLQNWKVRVNRYRIYKRCLLVTMVLSCLSLTGVTFYYLDSNIPSTIYVRADEEQSFSLGIPAKAQIISVSDQGASNIPRESVTIDLSRPVTVKAGIVNEYEMLVKLFGFLPFKQVGIRVIEEQQLIPVGVPVGIYVKVDGILVIGVGEFDGLDGLDHAPAKGILRSGDYIIKLNGAEIADKKEFMKAIEDCNGQDQMLTVRRNGEQMDLAIKPIKNEYGTYKIGTWIRDNAQGVGTMTYMDSQGNFGALGHGINDVDTSALLEMDDGTLYETEIIAVRKGTDGTPGEMTGMIVYSDEKILGDITDNRESGIFGVCNDNDVQLTAEEAMPVGLKQEINKGYAQILCTINEQAQYYDIEITEIHLDHDNVNRGIELKITDPNLLALTGGIIQGMSGSPVLQNGRIVGAVTHVLVNDPARGYGIFIENMLDAED